MKAIVYRRYGSSEVLRLEEVPRPNVPDNGVLVRVRAASLNPFDWYAVTGIPYLARLGPGLRRPKPTTPGLDFAGVVEAVGLAVTRFQPGDAVFGMRSGACAEYLCVGEEKTVSRMPKNITFEQAAAVPVAAGTALLSLRDKGHLRAGQRVLINGASGGVGTFAVQVAKALGAHVTGVCSTGKVDLVRSLGADQVIDYTRDDFTRGAVRYDLLLDNAGGRSWSDCIRVLKPRATVIVVGGPKTNRWLGPVAHFVGFKLASLPSWRAALPFMANVTSATLADLGQLLESGTLTPVIDQRFPLANIAEAMQYLGQGHAKGKIVITM